MPLRIRKPPVRNTPGPIRRGIPDRPRASAPQLPASPEGEPFEAEPLAYGSSFTDPWVYFADDFGFEDD